MQSWVVIGMQNANALISMAMVSQNENNSMLIAIYHMLSTGEIYKDLGNNYYNQFNRERKANGMLKKLKALGYEVTIATVATTA